jgi:hypothetical protein
VTVGPGHPTVYWLHIDDAFKFRKNVRVCEEQVGAGFIQQI